MVGVPGKYKDYGRECAGYERETVFIVGTQDDKGRVGSHPPRNIQQPRAVQSEASTQHTSRPEFVAAEPLQPAWHETVLLNSGPNSQLVRLVAQHNSAVNHSGLPSQTQEGSLPLLDCQPLDVTPTFREEIFNMKSICLVSLPGASGDSTVSSDEGVCLFLYQQNSSTMYAKEPPWNGMSSLADAIREPGPAAYQTFPAHHFFARVYRPSAIWASLLNRQPTFLCNPEWTVVPWEHYPRTSLDDLLDVVVLLPSIYSRADHITLLEADSDRQLRARELLDNCINIEAQFDIWLSMVKETTREPCWVNNSERAHIPFNEPLNFASPLLCLAHIYYWAVLIGFHQCIYGLLEVIRGPAEKGPSARATAGLHPALDPRKYQPNETRRLAALVCRSLDFALRTTTQPDLLVAPTWIVKDFYNRMHAIGLCELESLWINDFMERRETRGRKMSDWLKEKRWIGVRRFG
ncbi:hypothetical protein GQX73_g7808 [Xylaria multiplex]|uniref:Transcription factor domain-containing protein n=1 Tax=Xylaria multiplex TaxID=323545 RepID=A0A7C8MIU4_9PEZI|nr:hypothetical protein GQX73_g7808 [Xylaria multiplex]